MSLNDEWRPRFAPLHEVRLDGNMLQQAERAIDEMCRRSTDSVLRVLDRFVLAVNVSGQRLVRGVE